MQLRTDPLGAEAIVKAWHQEMGQKSYDDYGLVDMNGQKSLETLDDLEEEEAVMALDRSKKRMEWFACVPIMGGKMTLACWVYG